MNNFKLRLLTSTAMILFATSTSHGYVCTRQTAQIISALTGGCAALGTKYAIEQEIHDLERYKYAAVLGVGLGSAGFSYFILNILSVESTLEDAETLLHRLAKISYCDTSMILTQKAFYQAVEEEFGFSKWPLVAAHSNLLKTLELLTETGKELQSIAESYDHNNYQFIHETTVDLLKLCKKMIQLVRTRIAELAAHPHFETEVNLEQQEQQKKILEQVERNQKMQTVNLAIDAAIGVKDLFADKNDRVRH